MQQALGNTNQPLFSGPVAVVMVHRIPSPSSVMGSKRKLRDGAPHWHRPDGDNLEKFVNDALRGVVWDDDSRISVILRIKQECDCKTGSTLLGVFPLEHATLEYTSLLESMRTLL